MIFNVFRSFVVVVFATFENEGSTTSDPDKCRENYKIFFYHFYMIVWRTEWFSNGENLMLIAFPVFEI